MTFEMPNHQIFWFSRREWEIIILYTHVRYVRLPEVLHNRGILQSIRVQGLSLKLAIGLGEDNEFLGD